MDDRYERADDWIDRVLQAAGDLSADITPLEAAEALWLLAGFRSQQDANDASEPSDLDSSDDKIPDDDSESEEDEEDEEDDSANDLAANEARSAEAPQEPQEQITDVPVGIEHPDRAVGGWKPVGVELSRLPGLSDVRGQRAGLSDLATYAPDPRRLVLDVQRSIELSCRMREPFLAVRPGTSPATDVLLLVDSSVTMSPWQRQLERLNKLVRETAGLASWTVLHLDLSGLPRLRAVKTEPVQSVTAENRHETGDTVERWIRPGRRTLVLLWSDGIAPGFMELGGALASLPEDTTVAWLHPWPRHAWRRTAEGRLRLYQPNSRTRGRRSIPVVVVPPSRSAWHAVGAMLRGGTPAGFPVLALPAPRAQKQSLVEPARRRRAEDPLPKDEAGWTHYFKRLELHFHRDTLRLIGLLAAFPVERFSFEAAYALAMHAGLDTAGFLLAEALTAGVVKAERVDGTAWYSFHDGAARSAAATFVDQRDLQQALALHKDQLDHDAIELPVLVPAEGGEYEATATATRIQRIKEVMASRRGAATANAVTGHQDTPAASVESAGSVHDEIHARYTEVELLESLIEYGKLRGYVTYDDVNDAIPEHIASTPQIDSWLERLSDNDIEVVDDRGTVDRTWLSYVAAWIVGDLGAKATWLLADVEAAATALEMLVVRIDRPEQVRLEVERGELKTVAIEIYSGHASARIRCRAFQGEASPSQIDGVGVDDEGWLEPRWLIERPEEINRLLDALRKEWSLYDLHQAFLDQARASAQLEAPRALSLGRALFNAGGVNLHASATDTRDNFALPDVRWITPTDAGLLPQSECLAEGFQWLERSATEGVAEGAVDLARAGLLALEARFNRDRRGYRHSSTTAPPAFEKATVLGYARRHLERLAAALPPLDEATVLRWTSNAEAKQDVRVVRGRARMFAAGWVAAPPWQLLAEVKAAAETGSPGARWVWANLVLDLAASDRTSLQSPDENPWFEDVVFMSSGEAEGIEGSAALPPSKDDVDRAIQVMREVRESTPWDATLVTLAFANRLIERIGVLDREDEGWALLTSLGAEEPPEAMNNAVLEAVQVCRVLRTLFPGRVDAEARRILFAFEHLVARANAARRDDGLAYGGQLVLDGFLLVEQMISFVTRDVRLSDLGDGSSLTRIPFLLAGKGLRLPDDVDSHLRAFMELRNRAAHGRAEPSVSDACRAIETYLARLVEWALGPDATDWGSNEPGPAGLSPASALDMLHDWKATMVAEPLAKRSKLVDRTLRAIAAADIIEIGLLRTAADQAWPSDWDTYWTRHAKSVASLGVFATEVARLRDQLQLSTESGTPGGEAVAKQNSEPSPRPRTPHAPARNIPSPRKNPAMSLPKKLQPALRALEKDLLERAKLPGVEAGLRAAWEAEKKEGETGQGFDPWRRARVTQIAVAWVLSVVFVRTLEDRGLIDPRIAGPDAARLASARDREATFVQVAPFLGPREYLLTVFRELAQLPGAREVFDTRHNPVWVLAPSSQGARALLDFFQVVDGTTGAPVITFDGSDTRFLGDLYQDLSESVRKRYALLQTPDFVEKFILEQTLQPAIEEFGLAEVKLIDPTCGSGHFLLGAFRDLLAAWQRKEPSKSIEELASNALAQVFGVDINPYAVAIARFRLVLAVLDAVGIRRLDKAPLIRPKVVAADSLLHRVRPTEQLRLTQQKQISFDEYASWGDTLFRLAEPGAVVEVLRQRYHAVVGNPPYITEQDATKRNRYREMYESAAGKYALAAPFTERFFELAVEGGFVGMINSNAWTKRDYGKALIEKVLPRLDVQQIIDTSGCYLPGHGTPTLLLFGRNRTAGDTNVVAVMGKRGEQEVPRDPQTAPVWSEIVEHRGDVGFDGIHVSVENVDRQILAHSPWLMTGGGARQIMSALESFAAALGELGTIGVFGMTNANDCYLLPRGVPRRRHVEPAVIAPFYSGQTFRDWMAESEEEAIFPYGDNGLLDLAPYPGLSAYLWSFRTVLGARATFGGGTYRSEGLPWWKWHQVAIERIGGLTISFSYVSTHNQFWLGRGRNTFNQPAPLVKLESKYTEVDHQALLGYLNSSTVGFWCRLVMFPKGGDQVGDGARLSATQWNRHLEYAGNLLQQLPVPKLEELRNALLELVVAAEDTVAQISSLAPEKVVAQGLAGNPHLAGLHDDRAHYLSERRRLQRILVSLQEEMDWRVYGLLGLPTVTAPSVDAVRVPVEPNHRPFEVRLARDLDDVSASDWFRIHKREAPADVGGPLADLYRQRLRLLDDPERGRQLRLLETPETKRRWSPPDDFQAFTDAVRTWLLERIEAVFREQPTPQLRTARQLALDLGRDSAIQAAHELLSEATGLDLVRLVADLVDEEGVPFLAGFRYTVTGMEKRVSWEETWRLQRLEDAGQLAPELKRLGLTSISVPDKYANKDFQRQYWRLRGKLDVPKERFVTVPGGNTDDDPTPLVGWAGWDHLQAAQALAALYQRRKTDDGWTGQRLVPLLAGLAERVPWLLQWHNQPSDAYGGVKLGEFFRDFVAGEAHGLGVAVDFTEATDDLRGWTPPQALARKTLDPDELLTALRQWKPDVDEDEADEDVEPPAGPSADDLVGAVGASKTLVNAALKKLVADGRVEKLDGRPARYVATGEDA